MNGRWRRVAAALVAIPLSGLPGGCVVGSALLVAGDAAVTGAKVVGSTTVGAVKTVGHAVTPKSGGNTASEAVRGAGAFARTGMVTFLDTDTAVVVRVPWKRGLTLAGAAAAARLQVAQRAVDVVRSGRVVYANSRFTGAGAALASGDVVRLMH